MFRITIDQIPSGGGKMQRYGPYEPIDAHIVGAVEDALSLSGLGLVIVGHYQITVTDLNMDSRAHVD